MGNKRSVADRGAIRREAISWSLSHLTLQDSALRNPLICLTAFLTKADSGSVGAAEGGCGGQNCHCKFQSERPLVRLLHFTTVPINHSVLILFMLGEIKEWPWFVGKIGKVVGLSIAFA